MRIQGKVSKGESDCLLRIQNTPLRGHDSVYYVDKNVLERFELVIQQKKLSKVSDDRRLKAKVFRQLNFLGEIWYIEVEDKNTKYMVRYELMEQYTNIAKVDFYKKASWEGSQFVLRDRLDRETARIETQ